jgi:hypothetical protein
MLIALDYDGTHTVDPQLWLWFVRYAKALGHSVICVTMRAGVQLNGREDMDPALLDAVDETIFTAGAAKIPFLSSRDINPDVFIDDNPALLFRDGGGH